MRDSIIIFFFVIAGVVFCCDFVCMTIDEVNKLLNANITYTGYLSAVVDCGAFLAASFATLYAVVEYHNHKKEHRIRLLGEYNHRYSTDKNVQKIVTWMLKVAIVDDDGEIIGADPSKCHCKPDVNAKEMFMRFFEELYLQIENKSIDEEQACQLFSYYAIKFDEIKEFRLDITDYQSGDELEKGNDKKGKIYWAKYRNFVNEMRKVWIRLDKQQIKE